MLDETILTSNSNPERPGVRKKLDRLELAIPWMVALVGALIYHRYSIFTGFDQVQADIGDSRFVAFILEHWNAVLAGTATWHSPLIFYPVRGVLGYSDASVAMGALHVVLRQLGFGVFQAMNLGLVLWSLVGFATAYHFIRRGLGLSVLAATVGAYFFAFNYPRFAQLVHVQLQFTALLPVMAHLFLVCVRDGLDMTGRSMFMRLALLALLLVTVMATTFYYALFFAIALILALTLCLLHPVLRRRLVALVRRHVVALAGAAVVGAVLLVPMARVYVPVMLQSSGRSWAEITPYLANPLDLLWLGRENVVWGWLFDAWPERAERNWAELRIGVGAVATLAWIAAAIWAVRAGWESARASWGAGVTVGASLSDKATTRAAVIVIVLTGMLMQLMILRFGNGGSLWWLFYKAFPAASGVRAVARLEIIATLPMAVAFAYLVDRLTSVDPTSASRRWPLGAAVLTGVLAFGAMEQVGVVEGYSATAASNLARQVSAAVPAGCKAFYVTAATPLPVPPDIRSEKDFNARAYLAANPDVAVGWTGTPWEHYNLFGRKERRYLDPVEAGRHRALTYFYNYTIPLGATLAGAHAVNGLSGWQPPGWQFFDVFAPDPQARIAAWTAGASSGAKPEDVCIVPLDLDPRSLPTTPRTLFGAFMNY